MTDRIPAVPAPLDIDAEVDTLDGNDVADLLEHLAQTAEDGADGFTEAAEKIDDPAIEATFRELGAERAQFAGELRAFAATRYQEFVPSTGTVKGALHRGWMALKDALAGDDPHAVVTAAEKGEDYALEQWNEAIEQPLPDDVAFMVRRQRDAVKAAHDRVRALEVATE